MRSVFLLGALGLFGGLAACDADSGDAVTVHESDRSVNAKLDLLFVIDSSAAMTDLQPRMAAAYREMIDKVSTFSAGSRIAGSPDLRVGVITMDAADGGELRGGRYLAESTHFAWETERNFDGDRGDEFVALASVGTGGSATRSPIEMVDRVLGTPPGDFRRSEATFGIVMLTTGDDAGSEDVAAVATRWKSLFTDPSKLVVAAATGCDAQASPRLTALLAQFPNRNVQKGICDDDMTAVADIFGQLVKTTLGQPCMEPRPLEPHQCTSVLIDPLTRDEAALPECAGGLDESRCWKLDPSPGACSADAVAVQLPWTPFPALAHIECVTDP